MTTKGQKLAALLVLSSLAGLGSWLLLGLFDQPLRFAFSGRSFELSEPTFLRGLGLLSLFGLPSLFSRRGGPIAQRTLSAALRMLVSGLLLLSLSQPVELLPSDRTSTVVLVDVSQSIDDAFLAKARARIAALCTTRGDSDAISVVTFAREARRVPHSCGQAPKAWSRSEGDATDIESALLFALSQFEPDSARQLLLFSDGIETHGSMARAGAALRTSGARLFYVAEPETTTPETGIELLSLPDVVKTGAPFAVRASLRATHATSARLRLLRDDKLEPDGEKSIELVAGSNEVSFRSLCRVPGRPVYRLELLPDGADRLPQNNAFERAIRVLGKPRILYVERERTQAFALRDLLSGAGFDVDVRGPEGAPRSQAELGSFDFYILSDVARASLPEGSASAISGFLEDGGGFLMAGGDQSFGLGGYRNSPFERFLPVSLERKEKHDEPSLALSLVIDKSGSMSDEKIALAKEAARATARLLHEDDYLGVIGFDATPTHVVRMAAVQNQGAVERGIERLRAGGGTAIFPALDAAYADLSGVRARKKHVILLTDGQTREAGLDVLVQNMQLSDITLSTVGLGEDVSRGLLEELARLGHGRAYFTDDPKHVPRLFLHETETVAHSAAVEADVTALAAAPAAFLEGVHIESAPPLRGYVATTARGDLAQVVLQTANREPLLARMRVGLGWSLAFTPDLKPRWAASWFAWRGFSRMLSQLVREHMRAGREDELRIDTHIEDDELVGSLDVRTDAQRFVNGLSGSMRLRKEPTGEQLDQREVTQLGPGAYQARFAVREVGSYSLEADLHSPLTRPRARFDGAGPIAHRAVGFATHAYPREYRDLAPRPGALAALSRATGGGALGEGPFWGGPKDKKTAPRKQSPLWPVPVAAALLVFVLDVAVRRLWRPYAR